MRKLFFPLCAIVLLFATSALHAQTLARNISLQANRQKLGDVLQLIEQKGGFRFSYNSAIIPRDSLVTVNANDITIEELLSYLLKNQFEFKEANNFVIIRYAPLELLLVVKESYAVKDEYLISGQVIDKNTQLGISAASVYEKSLLQSDVTDADGMFTLRLKKAVPNIALTVSKDNYKDITVLFLAEVQVKHQKTKTLGNYFDGALSEIEKNWLGRLLTTSKQKIQSANLRGFIANAPYQASLAPTLSTHGSLSGQVVNHFSLNATGAYSAGVDGAEIGLLFNIAKRDVRYFQFGGAFNLVGGEVQGAQIGGVYNYVMGDVEGSQISAGYNRVLKSVEGVQIGGLLNRVQGDFKGLQIAAGHNLVADKFNGAQIGGVFNYTLADFKGIQLSAGFNLVKGAFDGVQVGAVNYSKKSKGLKLAAGANVTAGDADGVQLAAINYAKHLKGVHIGFVNIADSASGYTLGLLNLIRHGMHQLDISANELADVNVAYKNGSKKLYTLWLFSSNLNAQSRLSAWGLGVGGEHGATRKLSLITEISTRYLQLGEQDSYNFLNRADVGLRYRFTKWLAIHGGPAFNVLYSSQTAGIAGYAYPNSRYEKTIFRNPKLRHGTGYTFGISFF